MYIFVFLIYLLRNANSLDVTSCSTEQKSALYDMTKTSFSSQRRANTAHYQLISPYLGKHKHYGRVLGTGEEEINSDGWW